MSAVKRGKGKQELAKLGYEVIAQANDKGTTNYFFRKLQQS